MKSSDFIQEGPIDFAKRVAAGIKSAKLGYDASKASREATAELDKLAQGTLMKWKEQQAKDQVSGTALTPAQARQRIEQWAKSYFTDPKNPVTIPSYTGPVDTTGYASNIGALDFFKKLWANRQSSIRPQAPRQVKTYPTPTANDTVEVNGVTYEFDATAKQWKDDTGNFYQKNSDEEQQLNKAYYDSKTNPINAIATAIGGLTAAQIANLKTLLGWP